MPRFVFALISLLSLSAVGAVAQGKDDKTFRGRTKGEWLKILKEDKDAPNRSEAVAALSVMEPRDRAMLDAVADALLNDKSVRVRLRAVDCAVLIMGTSRTEEKLIIEAFGKSLAADSSETVRLKVANLSKELKGNYLRTLAPILVESLKNDKSSAVRSAAATALGRAGEQAKSVLNGIIDALKDTDPDVRAAAAEVLGRVGDEARIAIPALKPLLKDADAGVRLAAAFALGRVGPDGATAVPELVVVLAGDVDATVRKEAARAFALLGLDAKAAVPALVKALREDKADDVRQQAAIALGKMRGETRDVAKDMIEVMKKDAAKNVRIFVVHALGDSLSDGLRAYVKDLADQLISEPEAVVRVALVQELGALGPAAKDALPALNRAATDVQLSVRDEAKRAIKKVMGQ
jgi:HEAT repeat protein